MGQMTHSESGWADEFGADNEGMGDDDPVLLEERADRTAEAGDFAAALDLR